MTRRRTVAELANSAFVRQFVGSASLSGGTLLGVEHEFRVLRSGQQLDFRDLIHDLDLGVRGLDPGDEYAYRVASGSTLTCDEREAEIASPPERLEPGCTRIISQRAFADLAWLASTLGDDIVLEGYTTHLSVSVPTDVIDDVAELYCRTYAPALMLLLDRDPAPGLLVRPRPRGRLELCGWYVPPERLSSVVAFAAGSVLACVAAVRGTSERPPEIATHVVPAVIRYGWYVDRRACGDDLYVTGRASRIRRDDGVIETAQHVLERSWCQAREMIQDVTVESDLADTDEIVGGTLALPSEGDLASSRSEPAQPPTASPWAQIGGPLRRPRFDLAPVMATWDLVVFALSSRRRRRTAFVAVPRDALARFVSGVPSGEFDRSIARYLGSRPRGRLLSGPSANDRLGLYDALAARRSLLAPERNPDGSAPSS